VFPLLKVSYLFAVDNRKSLVVSDFAKPLRICGGFGFL